MKVISTNISEKRSVIISGESVETGMYKFPVEEIFIHSQAVNNDAVVDTRYHGGADMACYLFGKNNYAYFEKIFPDAEWETGMFGENITIDQLDESNLNIGDIYQIGEAVIQIAQPRIPCSKLGHRLGSPLAIKAFADAPFPGVYVRVLTDGLVKPNDSMELIESQKEKLSVTELYTVLTKKSAHTTEFSRVWSNTFVPDKCKRKLEE